MEQVAFEQLTRAIAGTAFELPANCSYFESIATDSRKIRHRDLFWCLKGDNFDGHDFAKNAIKQGAVACVVSAGEFPADSRLPRIEVDDTQEALLDLAAWYRRQLEPVVIGITGSVGKTTTRRMIFEVLATRHSGIQSPANFNNFIGVPLTVFQMESQHEFAVLELGASASGEIMELADVASPELGVITAIAPSHLHGFGSIENIVQAKGELVEALPSSGFAVLNGDDSRVRSLADRCQGQVILVGEGEHNHIRATNVTTGFNLLKFRASGVDYQVPVTGRHHLTSALAAVAVAQEIGLDPQEINDGLAMFTPASGRCEISHVGRVTLINDTYNSNPGSMQAAANILKDWCEDARRVMIVGDMKELGDKASDLHYMVGEHIGRAGIDALISYGDFAEDLADGAIDGGMPSWRVAACPNREILNLMLDCWLGSDDVVLVKGSRSTRMETVVEWIQQRYAGHSHSTRRRAA